MFQAPVRIFLASFLVLFHEVALIRWLPAQIRLLRTSRISSCWRRSWASGFACLTANGYFKVTGTDVPVIEGTLAGAHLARVYGSLRKLHGLSTSKQRTFKGLPAATVAQCLGPLRAQLAGG